MMHVHFPAQHCNVILSVNPCCALKELQAMQNLTFGTAVDNDLMTPSFKLKRPQLQKHYQKQIDEMYKEAKKGM